MAKKKDGRANNGGKRPNSGPRITAENKKKQINLGVKTKLVDSPEKFYRLKMAVYQFIEEVYEKNL